MTVHHTSYASLDEIWANSYLSPEIQELEKQKAPKPKRRDPLCDLYEKGYVDDDIVSYAYEKSRFQNPRMMDREPNNESKQSNRIKAKTNVEEDYDDKPSFIGPKNQVREKLEKVDNNENNRDDLDYYDSEQQLSKKSKRSEKIIYDTHEYYLGEEDPDYYKRNSEFNYLDIMLYVISGIILIFMMEQFVKIGMLLH